MAPKKLFVCAFGQRDGMSSAILIYILLCILAALAAAIPFGAALRRHRRRRELRRYEAGLEARLAWVAGLDAERNARRDGWE